MYCFKLMVFISINCHTNIRNEYLILTPPLSNIKRHNRMKTFTYKHTHTLARTGTYLASHITLFSLLGSVKKKFFFLIKKAKHIRKEKKKKNKRKLGFEY